MKKSIGLQIKNLRFELIWHLSYVRVFEKPLLYNLDCTFKKIQLLSKFTGKVIIMETGAYPPNHTSLSPIFNSEVSTQLASIIQNFFSLGLNKFLLSNVISGPLHHQSIQFMSSPVRKISYCYFQIYI